VNPPGFLRIAATVDVSTTSAGPQPARQALEMNIAGTGFNVASPEPVSSKSEVATAARP